MRGLSRALLFFFALTLASAAATPNSPDAAAQFNVSFNVEPLFIIGAGAIAVGMLRVRNRK